MNSTRKSHYETLLTELDLAVREGRVPSVRPILTSLNTAKIPPELSLGFAKLCRRVGLIEIGLRILSPAKNKLNQSELAEYAVLLQRSGVIDESLRILKTLPRHEVPEADLYEAFCHFNQWEYRKSLNPLRNYISKNLGVYEKLVGQVNLAAALTACDEFKEAKALLRDIIELAHSMGHRRLEGNCHEILAQIQIIEGDTKSAHSSLKKAHSILAGENTVAELSVLKWMAVLEARETGSAEKLKEFRQQALALKDWETVRHADLYILYYEFSAELFNMHLFGSPWLGYREKAQRMVGHVIESDSYIVGNLNAPLLDLRNGQLNGQQVLPFGGSLHKTLEALSRDFYRPIPVGSLFGLLFPDEHYDIYSSPNRVHQLVFRLRKWIADEKLPLEVQQFQDAYKLAWPDSFGLIVAYEKRTPEIHHQTLQSLKKVFSSGECFKLKQASEALSMPVTQLRSFCNWAQEQGYLEKSGAGSSTVYTIISNATKKAA